MRKEIKSIFCFNLNDISIYRSELMGWSIIWIMMLHFRFLSIIPLGFIAQYGFTRVDIFLLGGEAQGQKQPGKDQEDFLHI